jgi:thiol-disulfide isomerase/thioredoxin
MSDDPQIEPTLEQLAEHPVMIVVFTQDGCDGCQSYKPKFQQVADAWSQCVPVAMLDAEKYEDLSNNLYVRSTPSTFILYHGKKSAYQLIGDAPIEDIESVFSYAQMGEGCPT